MADISCEERVQGELEDRLEDLRSIMHYERRGKDHPQMGGIEEYGLCLDYVDEGTFEDQPLGYWRYQISWGGPSDEFRLYDDNSLTYVYMDWFDGAEVDIRGRDRQLVMEVLECLGYE